MSDPVDGRYVIVSTTDGTTWTQPGKDKRSPPMLVRDGEAAFAASGTCLIARGKNELYLVTGGMDARVFSSRDRGMTWTSAEPPFIKGTSGSGIFSIAMADESNGIIVGGDYEKPQLAERNLAVTNSGGALWAARSGLSGYRSGVAYIDERTLVAVGTNGSDMSTDQGVTWGKFGTENLNVVGAKGRRSVWAAGPNGLIVRMR